MNSPDLTRPLDVKHHYLVYPRSRLPALNPYAGLARDAATAWFKRLGVVHDAISRRVLEEERADLYGGFPYPTANFEHLTTVTKFLALWMLFDDLVTERSGAYWTAHDLGIADYAAALRGGALSPNADPFLRAWSELGQAFAARMSRAWCERLADAFVAWIEMTIRERETYAKLREQRALPSVETYLEIRSITVGVVPTFHFIEYVEGFELPAEVVNHPLIAALHHLGMRLELLSNDLASLEKDLASGWPGMVTVLQAAEDLSLGTAVARVVELHNDTLALFLSVEAALPSFGADLDPFVRVYVQRIHHVVRGFAQFQLEAERYRWKGPLARGRAPFTVDVASFGGRGDETSSGSAGEPLR